MNAQGDVVGWALFDAAPAGVSSFLWHAGAFTRLPDNAALGTAGSTCSGAPVEEARGASAMGVIFGNINGTSKPSLWASPSAMPVQLGDGPLPSGCELRTALVGAINAQGDYTGMARPTGQSCQFVAGHAFLVPAGGALQDLLAPDQTGCSHNDYTEARGSAVNAHDDTVIIQGALGANCPRAAFLDRGGSVIKLPFPLLGAPNSWFNDADTLLTQSGGQLGYSVAGGALQTLTPIDGLPSAAPGALNNQGDVVGESYDGSTNRHVFTLWPQAVPPATGIAPAPVDLQSLIPASAGVTLMAVTGMSDTGSILARVQDASGQQEWVVLEPGGQRISGTITDPQGRPLPAVLVHITGTSSAGVAVDITEVSDIDGNYAATLDSGSYTVTPLPRTGSPDDHFGHVHCDGTETPGTCAITLTAGTPATASFRLEVFVVNSTAVDDEPTRSLTDGVCDTTPDGPAQTCTLPAAIALVNHLGGGTITFNIPTATPNLTPVISIYGMPYLHVPVVIDGTTQPGSHAVGVTGAPLDASPVFYAEAQLGDGFVLAGGSAGSTIRGMDIWGFDDPLGGDIYIIGGGRDTIVGNQLGTRPSPDLTSQLHNAIVADRGTTGGNVIQSNVVGGNFEGNTSIRLSGGAGGDTIGGAGPGQGNTMTYSGLAVGDHSVVQGNTLNGADVSTGAGSTVGGPTPVPGTGAGNTIHGALDLGDGSVAQGNRIYADGRAGIMLGAHDTAGGAQPQMGNLILGESRSVSAGISVAYVGATGTPGAPFGRSLNYDGNVIQNNVIEGISTAHERLSIGAIVIVAGTGNRIFENTLRDDSNGIILGNGAYQYNGLYLDETDPNLHQPYPLLFDAFARDGRIDLSGRLTAHRNSSYTIDLYEQATCAQDSVTPGVGQHDLGREQVHTDAFGRVQFTLTFPDPPRARAMTATATAPNGSTSEFSPCLTLGRAAPTFDGSGVTLPGATIQTQPAARSKAKGARAPARAVATAKVKRLVALVHPFCPPRAKRSCSATVTLTSTRGKRSRIASGRIQLAPGQLGTLKLGLPVATARQLAAHHRLRVLVSINAHDAARHRISRHTRRRAVLLG